MTDHPDWETLLHFGCEGAGMTVQGRRRPDGAWELQLASDSMTFDANDDEAWTSTTRPIASLAEAFEGCRDCFGAMVPVEPVHEAFRAEMRAVIEQLAPRTGGPAYELWVDRNYQRWLDAC
ncbi:MAG: hypothetical protein MUE60_16235 [Candidatus Eisenbacteria bacterium]|jgi:hypothetical protein|nr:hypothetical protein [Candidatus Eisenbacteria bacterium]